MIEWKKQLDEAQRVEDEKMAKQHRADMDANTYIKDQVGIIEIRMVMKFQVMMIINTVSTQKRIGKLISRMIISLQMDC